MKKILLLLIIFLFMPSTAIAGENQDQNNIDTGELVDEILEQVDTYELENIIGQMNIETKDYLPSLNIREIISSLARGKFSLNSKDLFMGIMKYLFNEVIMNSGILARLILLSIICALLQNLQSSFESHSVGEIAYNIVYFVILGMAIQSFAMAIKIGVEAIDSMVQFMYALLPTLIALLTATGALSSAALFQPIVTFTVNMLSTFVKNIILPLIFFGAILNLINYISSKVQIYKLAGLIKQATVVLLGFVMTIFLGIMTIQGVAASSFDGVTARTAKYAVDNLIPIIGGFLSDAVDTIIGCSLLIKNAVGAFGLFFLFIIILFPLIKIVALILIYKLSSAMIEPIADGRIVDSLNDMAKSLILVFVAVLSVAIMFFIVVTIIISTGNITVMMR